MEGKGRGCGACGRLLDGHEFSVATPHINKYVFGRHRYTLVVKDAMCGAEAIEVHVGGDAIVVETPDRSVEVVLKRHANPKRRNLE